MSLPVHVLRADRSDGAVVVGFAAVAVYFAVLVHGMGTWPYEQWMVLVLVPLLFTAGVVGILVVTRDDTDRLTSIMVAGLVAKLGAAFVRYFVVFAVYRGGDSIAYDVRAEAIADAFHDGRSTLGSLLPTRTGTGFIDDLTGLIYTVMGPSRLGGFLVYAFIGYWGLVLFHRAARIGLPSLDERRYAMLLYFMPALVFWPSSIGKEAVMMLAIGCAAFGAARVLERRRNGLLPLAAGVGLTYQVRPHVAFVLMVALAVAILFRSPAAATTTDLRTGGPARSASSCSPPWPALRSPRPSTGSCRAPSTTTSPKPVSSSTAPSRARPTAARRSPERLRHRRSTIRTQPSRCSSDRRSSRSTPSARRSRRWRRRSSWCWP